MAFSKHPELAVKACTELGLPLKVVGVGKMLPTLQQMAGPTVEFLGAVTDEALAKLYLGAKALLYPAEDEDFGIVPVEAMAYGTPVLAHASGGPLETVIPDKTGLFLSDLSVEAMKTGLKELEQRQWNATAMYHHAQQFSRQRFISEIKSLVKHSKKR
jgi:glycosyltransferase involved in cell wall biosynthesis